MKDLEAIAEIVTDAAIKAARKVMEPMEAKVESIGRSIDSHAVMSRKSVEQAQEALDFARESYGEIEEAHHTLRQKFLDAVKGNASVFERLLEKDQDLTSVVDSLPDYVSKQLEVVQKEYESSFTGIRKAIGQLEGAYLEQKKLLEAERGQRDLEIKEQVKALSELAEEKIKEIKSESKGDKGDPGEPGPPGEIGSMKTPVPWTGERMYKMGDAVVHRGGTWYCEQNTAEEPGGSMFWTCLANGIDVKSCYEQDGVFNQVYADGSRIQFRVQPRRMGVWKNNEQYIKGDLVTYNYSQYRALTDDPTQIPGKKIPDGENPQWHTEVGRGQKGQRGLPGDPQDAAAIVYSMVQKDVHEATQQMADYLDKVSL